MKTIIECTFVGAVLLFGAMPAQTTEQKNDLGLNGGEFSILNPDYVQTQTTNSIKLKATGPTDYTIAEYLGYEKRIAIVRDSQTSHQFVFHDRADAELARRLWQDSKYSMLEIYLAFGGNLRSAPKDFLTQHQQLRGKDTAVRHTDLNMFRTSEPGHNDYGGLGPTDLCYNINGLDNCNVYGNVRVGLISTPFGICDESNGDDFDDWEHYLVSHLYNPFDGSPFPLGFSNLGDLGQLGSGIASGRKYITIPPVRSGGILVCDRPDSAVYRFDMVIEEELFPNAWFVLYDDGHSPGMVYGIAFDGDFLHQSIRIRIEYPEDASNNAEFYWAATY